MLPSDNRGIRLFKAFGIQVYLDWTWFIVAYLMINNRRAAYSSLTWNILEYLALFGLVLLHEFGHSLACRQVGGRADRIVLWPLGGVAFVSPPPRPGAHLWSLAAGPLVNVVLFPVLWALREFARAQHWDFQIPNLYELIDAVCYINGLLLVFNLLPIYPLDGGQILRTLLWFVIGPVKSLYVATVLGFAGAAGLVALAYYQQSIWTGVMAAFVFMNCARGWRTAQELARAAKAPPLP